MSKRLLTILLIIVALFLGVSCNPNPNEKENGKPNEEQVVPGGGETGKESITVTVTAEKNLAEALKEKDLEEATELIILGTLANADFTTLKNMTTLKSLDISGITNTEIPQKGLSESYFETIILPEKLESIGAYSFALSSLTEVVIPNGVKRIEEGAFFKSLNLAKLDIPASVEYIGGWIIQQYDYDLDKMPKEATAITVNIAKGEKALVLDKGAFGGGKIKKINIPDSVTVIPDVCFAQTYIDEIELSDKIEFIGYAAFQNSFLVLKDNTLVLPAELKVLGPWAFGVQNEYSYNVKINGKLEYIYQNAFVTGFKIEEFDLPATLKGFSKSCLATREGLKRVIFRGETPPKLIPHYGYNTITFEDGKYVGTEDPNVQPQQPLSYRDVVAYVPAASLEAYKARLVCDDNLNPFGKDFIKSIDELGKE